MGLSHPRSLSAALAALAVTGAAAAPASADISGRTKRATVALSQNYLTVQLHSRALARRMAGRRVTIVCGRTLGRGAAVVTDATWTPAAVGPARFSFTFPSSIESRVDRCGIRPATRTRSWYLRVRLR